jgi:hypothetical protein
MQRPLKPTAIGNLAIGCSHNGELPVLITCIKRSEFVIRTLCVRDRTFMFVNRTLYGDRSPAQLERTSFASGPGSQRRPESVVRPASRTASCQHPRSYFPLSQLWFVNFIAPIICKAENCQGQPAFPPQTLFLLRP